MGGELLAQVRPVVRPQHVQGRGRLVPAILARRPAGSGPNAPYHVEALGEVRLDAVHVRVAQLAQEVEHEGHLRGRVQAVVWSFAIIQEDEAGEVKLRRGEDWRRSHDNATVQA